MTSPSSLGVTTGQRTSKEVVKTGSFKARKSFSSSGTQALVAVLDTAEVDRDDGIDQLDGGMRGMSSFEPDFSDVDKRVQTTGLRPSFGRPQSRALATRPIDD